MHSTVSEKGSRGEGLLAKTENSYIHAALGQGTGG